MKKQELKGQLSPDEVSKLKKEHPGAFAIASESGKIAYFRKPTWDDLNIASAQVSADTPLDYTKELMQECFVAGCNDIVNDQDEILGAARVFNKKIEGVKCSLVEL